MSNPHGNKKIFGTTAGQAMVEKICARLSMRPGQVDLKRHNDGEVEPRILEDVRGRDVFIVSPLHPPAENFFELGLLSQAAKGSSASRVTLVIPYMGYARSDRKSASRMPVGIKFVLDSLAAGGRPDRLVILDIHSEQSLSIPSLPVDHLFGSTVLVPELRKHFDSGVIIASPDIGGSQRAGKYAEHVGDDFVIISKRRTKAGEVDRSRLKLIGSVKGKHVVFVDDIIDTGGTMIAGAEMVKQKGARSVSICATHALFSKNALDRLQFSLIDKVFVTDTVAHDYDKLVVKYDKLQVVSVGGLLADAIRRVNENESLSELILK